MKGSVMEFFARVIGVNQFTPQEALELSLRRDEQVRVDFEDEYRAKGAFNVMTEDAPRVGQRLRISVSVVEEAVQSSNRPPAEPASSSTH